MFQAFGLNKPNLGRSSRYEQHVDNGVCSCKNIGRWDLDISTRKGYLS